jgi:hypothetical protein
MEPDDSVNLAIERTKVELERTKLAMDLVKHLSTLATGAIALTATLLERFPKPLREQDTLIWSVICFITCTVSCTVYWFLGAILGHWLSTNWNDRQVRLLFVLLAVILTASFAAGVIFLGIFAIKNLSSA